MTPSKTVSHARLGLHEKGCAFWFQEEPGNPRRGYFGLLWGFLASPGLLGLPWPTWLLRASVHFPAAHSHPNLYIRKPGKEKVHKSEISTKSLSVRLNSLLGNLTPPANPIQNENVVKLLVVVHMRFLFAYALQRSLSVSTC